MPKRTFQRSLLPLLLATCSAAQAGVLTFHDGRLRPSLRDTTPALAIDAAHPMGDWAKSAAPGAPAPGNAGSVSNAHLPLIDDMLLQFASGSKTSFFVGSAAPGMGSVLAPSIPGGGPQQLPALVSEPRSVAMLLGGLAMLGMFTRRRKGE